MDNERPRLRRLAAVVGLIATGSLVLGACSKASDNATPATSSLATIASTTTAPPAPRAVCDAGTLTPVVTAKFPGATVDDVACNATQAALTVVGAPDIPGAGVALLAFDNGYWNVVASGPVDSDPATLVPPTVSANTYRIWRDKYEARTLPPAPTTTRVYVPTTKGQYCEGVDKVCVTTTRSPDAADTPIS